MGEKRGSNLTQACQTHDTVYVLQCTVNLNAAPLDKIDFKLK